MKKKWWLVVAGVVIVVAIVVLVLNNVSKPGNAGLNSGNVDNLSGDLGQPGMINASGEFSDGPIEVDGFTVEDLSIEYEDGYTFLKGNIFNNTETDYPTGAGFRISIFQGEKLLITIPVMTSTLMRGEKSLFETQITMDCSLATEVKVSLMEG